MKLREQHPEIFKYFLDIVENRLKIIDERTTNKYKNDYLIIGFELWKSLEKRYLEEDNLQEQVKLFLLSDDELIKQILQLNLFSSALDPIDVDEIRETEIHLNQLTENINRIIDLESTNSYESKRLFYSAYILQIASPKEYPFNKNNINQKALIKAKGIIKYDKSFYDETNHKTEHFINLLEYYKHFKLKQK